MYIKNKVTNIKFNKKDDITEDKNRNDALTNNNLGRII